MIRGLTNAVAGKIRDAVRNEERARRDGGRVKWTATAEMGLPRPLVITNCTTGTAGVVKVKLADAPGSATPATDAEEVYAWLGTDAFALADDPVWGIAIAEAIGSLDLDWLILDLPVGTAHWAAPTEEELSELQDNPGAATRCGG